MNMYQSLNNKINDNLKKYDNIHINSTENSIPYIINFSILNMKARDIYSCYGRRKCLSIH